jgi:tRNA(Ile)-lysidine synthase
MQPSTDDESLLRAVEATIRQHHMLDQGVGVVVGVSGGPDSVALLHLLSRLSPRWSLRLVVAHLNHKLRGPAADAEADFVATLASGLGVPCETSAQDVARFASNHRLSIQEAARAVRYAFYDEVASAHSASRIALGHHAGDNAESILIHLFRGTGPLGLSGIPPVREERIIRPLLDVTRRQILTFLEDQGLPYVEDSSNADLKYLRNRIRHELLPELKKHYNPNIDAALSRLSSILRDEEHFWNHQVEQAFQDSRLEQGADGVCLSAAVLRHLHPALLRRVVRKAIAALLGNLRRLDHAHVEAVSSLITAPSHSGHLHLPLGVRVLRAGARVRFSLAGPDVPVSFEYRIDGLETTWIREIDTLLTISECPPSEIPDPRACPGDTALFDRTTVSFPMTVRSLKEGDRFRPLGLTGSQKVKTFFINQKVPRPMRSRCPILISGGKIIWLGGYRTDDSVKITGQTKRVLKAKLVPASHGVSEGMVANPFPDGFSGE